MGPHCFMKFVKQWVMPTASVLASQRLSIPSHSQLYSVGMTSGYDSLKVGCRKVPGTYHASYGKRFPTLPVGRPHACEV